MASLTWPDRRHPAGRGRHAGHSVSVPAVGAWRRHRAALGVPAAPGSGDQARCSRSASAVDGRMGSGSWSSSSCAATWPARRSAGGRRGGDRRRSTHASTWPDSTRAWCPRAVAPISEPIVSKSPVRTHSNHPYRPIPPVPGIRSTAERPRWVRCADQTSPIRGSPQGGRQRQATHHVLSVVRPPPTLLWGEVGHEWVWADPGHTGRE
jgi:hypothetical protein